MHGNYKNFQGPISLYIKTEKNKLFFLLRVSHFFAEVLQTFSKYYWYLNIFSSSLWKRMSCGYFSIKHGQSISQIEKHENYKSL